MNKRKVFTFGAIAGICLLTGRLLSTTPNVNKIKVYQRKENKPKVMRLYKGGKDGIYVKTSEQDNKYISLERYLKTILNEADRNIEKAQIEKIVKWNEE